eukprot:4728571-Pyramimonas_sp.AAC.1
MLIHNSTRAFGPLRWRGYSFDNDAGSQIFLAREFSFKRCPLSVEVVWRMVRFLVQKFHVGPKLAPAVQWAEFYKSFLFQMWTLLFKKSQPRRRQGGRGAKRRPFQ